MVLSAGRVRDPCRAPGGRAGEEDLYAGGPVLAGPQFRALRPGPAREKQGAVCEVGPAVGEVARGGDESRERLHEQRGDGGDGGAGCRLRNPYSSAISA